MIVNLKEQCIGKRPLPNPGWEASYIGIPFLDGGRQHDVLDCWGLLCSVYAHELGIELPTFATVSFDEDNKRESYRRLHACMSEDIHANDWTEVAEGLEQPLDVLLLRMGGFPVHVAIVANADMKTMLHTEMGIDSMISRYTSPMWSSRVHNIYRHREMVDG